MATDLEKQRTYVETITAACPVVPIRSARLQDHDGEFNDILVVNEEWIFRFPRRAENIPAFQRERQLLTRLQPFLPLPIPNPLFGSGPAAGSHQVFMGYPLIPGQPLDVQALEAAGQEDLLQTLAEQLADFLAALHHLDPVGLAVDLPEMDMPAWTRTFFETVRLNLFSYMREDACKTVIDVFEAYFHQENLHIYQPCLIHGDFGGSNILFDGQSISGVLDFAGACISDPALDLASVSVYGERFLERICRHYSMDGLMCRRAAFYRSLFGLEEALYGWRTGDEEAFSRGMEQYI